mmetsp:Transcript_38842/g.54166  ORF Transcript_38842/g.54166 Transcript_38842/m.54166 type:complete len:372 (+) Transcript_38842:119-1234(+)
MMNSKEMLCLLLLSLSVATGLKTAIGDGQVSTEFSLRLNGDLAGTAVAEAILKQYAFTQVQGVFLRENSTYTPPYRVANQLPNFASVMPWPQVLDLLDSEKNRRLLYCIRHGQAWENLSPSNRECSFKKEGVERPVFDSPLTFTGVNQTVALNSLWDVPANNSGNMTWFDALHMGEAIGFVSPITRAMQTSHNIFHDMSIQTPVTVSEILRAGLNKDRCNYRRPVSTPTNMERLSPPWDTGCDYTNNSLVDLWRGGTFVQLERSDMGLKEIWANTEFQFTVQPPGGGSSSLYYDVDELWRSDWGETDPQLQARLSVALAEMFLQFPQQKIFFIVTHSECCEALNELFDGGTYDQANVEVSPFLLDPVHNLF